MQKQIEHIISNHKDKIFKTCLGFTFDVEEAKDLVQEVLVNIWLGLEKFRKESSISTWVYRITVNTCLMHQRKKKILLAPLNEFENQLAEDSIISDPADNHNLSLLRKFLSELPDKDRVIMVLYLENLRYQEISEITGLSSNHIGVKINRIKKSISKKFKQHGKA